MELAQKLDVTVHWVYGRIHNGCIQVTKDDVTGLYLFPDTPVTWEQFKQLKIGRLQHLRFQRSIKMRDRTIHQYLMHN
jgi:hypothetical protein